ncbi:MAG TPA: HAD-IA family hydrolase [Bryobacteraceae bacterium]|nr:HAD-IA family hydrolase [Bryobacteraceae bacterium]
MLIIFDLDGTLIDSAQDLAISMNATRRHFGLPEIDPALIYSYVGNGAAILVQRAMGGNVPEEHLADALKFFLQFYRAHALEHTKLYPGVREAVLALSNAGHQLAVLTNKPVRISFDIVGALGLASHFMRVYGGDSFPAKKPDPVAAQALMEEAGTSTAATWLVGDSAVDVKTARNAGVRSCGVTWGFQPESFELHPPNLLIREPAELLKLVQASVTH